MCSMEYVCASMACSLHQSTIIFHFSTFASKGFCMVSTPESGNPVLSSLNFSGVRLLAATSLRLDAKLLCLINIRSLRTRSNHGSPCSSVTCSGHQTWSGQCGATRITSCLPLLTLSSRAEIRAVGGKAYSKAICGLKRSSPVEHWSPSGRTTAGSVPFCVRH